MKKEKTPSKIENTSDKFAIHPSNFKLLLLGFFIVVLGFVLMAGGGSDDPNVFKAEEIFSFRRITLSTILIIFGFGFEVYAIMRRPADKSTKNEDNKI